MTAVLLVLGVPDHFFLPVAFAFVCCFCFALLPFQHDDLMLGIQE